VYNNSSVLNNVFIFLLGGRPHNFNSRKWKDLCNLKITEILPFKYGNTSDIPKKGDLSDCNNYVAFLLLTLDYKLFLRLVTSRISDYSFFHSFIRHE